MVKKTKAKEERPMNFILHVGAPKTASTSIQSTLENNFKTLEKYKIKYLGLMLEYAYEEKYVWQEPTKISQFHTLTPEKAKIELINILEKTIEKAHTNNIEKLIWSNESFLIRNENILPALVQLQNEKKINIQIIVYVRDYIKWSKSAYMQWGIKHKAYNGVVKSFNTWNGHKIFYFSHAITNIMKQFPNSVFVRNMENIKDVVDDFFYICKISIENIEKKRLNDTPSSEELFLRALFNSKFKNNIVPNIFNQQIKSSLNIEGTVEGYMHALMPTKNNLVDIQNLVKKDRQVLNTILIKQGQEPIYEQKIPKQEINIDFSKLLMNLSNLVLSQSIEINKLTEDLESLKGIKK